MRDIFDSDEPDAAAFTSERAVLRDIFMPVREVFLGATERVNARIAQNNARAAYRKAKEMLVTNKSQYATFREKGKTYGVSVSQFESGINVAFISPEGYDGHAERRRFEFTYDKEGNLSAATELTMSDTVQNERPLCTDGIFDDARTARVALVATANILYNQN